MAYNPLILQQMQYAKDPTKMAETMAPGMDTSVDVPIEQTPPEDKQTALGRLFEEIKAKKQARRATEDPLERKTRRALIANAIMGGVAGLGDLGVIGAKGIAEGAKPLYGRSQGMFQKYADQIQQPLRQKQAMEAQTQAAKATAETKLKGDQFKNEQTLRTQFQKLTAPFRVVRDSYGRVMASAKDPSAAGDLALIFNYMKILDPGSVVRESEFANAQNAAGVPERVRNLYNRVLEGKKLGDNQRNDFIDRADRLYKQQEKQYKATEKTYNDLAKEYGLTPSNVTVGTLVEKEKLPKGVTEEDIKYTMKKHNLTREEVLAKLRE